MSDKNSSNRSYEPVSKTAVTYTMVHPASLDPAKMDVEDIAYHLRDGEFVGARTSIETNPIADSDVAAELVALGSPTNMFEADTSDDLEKEDLAASPRQAQ